MTHRRLFLVGAAALAGHPAGAALPAADPLPGLLAARAQREADWHAALDTFGDETPEAAAAWQAFEAAERALETTVATSPEGVAAQIEHIKASYGSGLAVEETPAAHDVPFALLDVILEGLRRLEVR